MLSHEKLSHEKLSYEMLSHEKLSHEKLSHEKLSHEKLSHEKLSHEKLSHEKLSHEMLLHDHTERSKPVYEHLHLHSFVTHSELTSLWSSQHFWSICGREFRKVWKNSKWYDQWSRWLKYFHNFSQSCGNGKGTFCLQKVAIYVHVYVWIYIYILCVGGWVSGWVSNKNGNRKR